MYPKQVEDLEDWVTTLSVVAQGSPFDPIRQPETLTTAESAAEDLPATDPILQRVSEPRRYTLEEQRLRHELECERRLLAERIAQRSPTASSQTQLTPTSASDSLQRLNTTDELDAAEKTYAEQRRASDATTANSLPIVSVNVVAATASPSTSAQHLHVDLLGPELPRHTLTAEELEAAEAHYLEMHRAAVDDHQLDRIICAVGGVPVQSMTLPTPILPRSDASAQLTEQEDSSAHTSDQSLSEAPEAPLRSTTSQELANAEVQYRQHQTRLHDLNALDSLLCSADSHTVSSVDIIMLPRVPCTHTMSPTAAAAAVVATTMDSAPVLTVSLSAELDGGEVAYRVHHKHAADKQRLDADLDSSGVEPVASTGTFSS
eukprot:TRINITY_DN9927_c0_g1_i1.p1 TRINITY_DN9927_c0_g1~~TRINITY_DN9927_c0_g1_i1.p1  ORF type:complete len:375 (+),score=97.04 TRINITY_DN9927_c0_g1_i1:266-1390(+)